MVNYCQDCGKPVEYREIENRQRAVCVNCGRVFYEHRKVSAGARVMVDGKLLLVQRGIEPWKGYWHLPSGYMEVDEDPRQTAEREVLEETGLAVKTNQLVDVYPYSDDPRGNGIVIVYDAELINGRFTANHETLNAKFFSPNEIRDLELAGMCAETSIQDWLDFNSPDQVKK